MKQVKGSQQIIAKAQIGYGLPQCVFVRQQYVLILEQFQPLASPKAPQWGAFSSFDNKR